MKRVLAIAVVAAALLALPAGAVAAGPQISGTVTPLAAAAETEVCLVETPVSENCTYPLPDGTYTLTGVPLGQDRVEFLPSYRSRYVPQYYQHARTLAEATSITVSALAPERAGVDAELELGGQIEGTVTAAPNQGPLAGVEVCALDAGRGMPYGCTFTDVTGAYVLAALPTGTYEVGFFGRDVSAEYEPQYYDETTTFAQATVISVAAGTTKAGVDAEMRKGAQVHGTVIGAAGGGGLADVPVCLFATTAARPSQCVYTDSDGTYALLGIPSGSYQVGFSLGSTEIGREVVSSEDDGYLPQYYGGVANRLEAQTLMLTAPQVVSGINASLTSPQQAPPFAPPGAVLSPTVAAPQVITEPARPKPRKCGRGYVKKNVKGAIRCIKQPKKDKKKHPKKHSKQHRQPQKVHTPHHQT